MEEKAKALFKAADSDSDGYITGEELSTILSTKFDGRIPDEQINLLVRIVDRDSNNRIDFREFLEIVNGNVTKMETEDEIRRVFVAFDRKKSGFLLKSDLKEILSFLGGNLTEDEIDELMRITDLDGDGRISVDEFIKSVKG